MDLDSVTAVIRPRGPWEAVDMGLRMVMARGKLIYATMALLMLPLYSLIVAVSYLAGAVEVSMLVFWWLKPMLDRIVLHILSRSLFGDEPGVRSTLRQSLRLAFGAGIVQALTVYRLDPARSLNLPVWQLENLRGARRWQRARILHRDTWGVATLLTLFCSSLEAVGMFSVYAILALMIPPELNLNLEGWLDYFVTGDGPTAFSLVHIVIYAAVICLVEPLFVSGGFALYLNRRTILEAWDIELAFRRLAARHKAASAAAAVALCLCISLLLITPDTAVAQSADADPAVLIEQILADPAFDTHEPSQEWVPHYRSEDDGDEATLRAPEWLLRTVARGAEFAIWATVIGLAAFLWLRRQLLRAFFQRPAARHDAPDPRTPRHRDIATSAQLPGDIPNAVLALWQQQRFTEAVSLLYRGTLDALRTRYGLRLGESATEGDWLRAVQSNASSATSRFFNDVTRAWQHTAYAQQAPAGEDLQALCQAWPQHFGQRT